MKFPGWLSVGSLYTEDDYRANRQGLNIFFGAVLGVVMGKTEKLSAVDFGFVLVMTAALVVLIQRITFGSLASRLFYSVATIAIIFSMPELFDSIYRSDKEFPVHIQVTLLVWVGMVAVMEFTPRKKVAAPSSLLGMDDR
jgi:hypothetical protein